MFFYWDVLKHSDQGKIPFFSFGNVISISNICKKNQKVRPAKSSRKLPMILRFINQRFSQLRYSLKFMKTSVGHFLLWTDSETVTGIVLLCFARASYARTFLVQNHILTTSTFKFFFIHVAHVFHHLATMSWNALYWKISLLSNCSVNNIFWFCIPIESCIKYPVKIASSKRGFLIVFLNNQKNRFVIAFWHMQATQCYSYYKPKYFSSKMLLDHWNIQVQVVVKNLCKEEIFLCRRSTMY